MIYETDMPTYEDLVKCMSELYPEIKIELKSSDPMLAKLGFVEKIPCEIDVQATEEQIKNIMDDAIDFEVAAFSIDNEKSKEWKLYERYGWLFDFFFCGPKK